MKWKNKGHEYDSMYQEIEKKKSLEEQEKYEESLKETKLSVVDAHIYKEKIHNYRLTRWICDEEISRLRQERDEFVKICNKFKLETDLAHQKYNELFNSLYVTSSPKVSTAAITLSLRDDLDGSNLSHAITNPKLPALINSLNDKPNP